MKNKLSGIEDTLYIPLAARIYASKRFPYFFYDEKALELEEHILKLILQNFSIWQVLAGSRQ